VDDPGTGRKPDKGEDHSAQKIDSDKFEKDYSYNIRHMYGKEGKGADYRPWNCNKVLNQTAPGVGEYHGCPLKLF